MIWNKTKHWPNGLMAVNASGHTPLHVTAKVGMVEVVMGLLVERWPELKKGERSVSSQKDRQCALLV
jgi:hypothetical protein